MYKSTQKPWYNNVDTIHFKPGIADDDNISIYIVYYIDILISEQSWTFDTFSNQAVMHSYSSVVFCYLGALQPCLLKSLKVFDGLIMLIRFGRVLCSAKRLVKAEEALSAGDGSNCVKAP